MENTPRRHHFVPESYLKNFGNVSNKECSIWTHELSKNYSWKGKPKKTGHIRDFYRVKVREGGNEFGVEKAFSIFESTATPVIRNLMISRIIPTDKNYNILLNYIAHLILRTPTFKSFLKNEVFKETKKIMMNVVSSEENFDKEIKKLKKRNQNKNYTVTYNEFKNVIQSKDYDIEIDNNLFIENFLSVFDKMLSLLGQRHWSIHFINNDINYFITSDNPVSLTWNLPFKQNNAPAFGLMGTEISFPVDKKTMLLGRFENDHHDSEADENFVSIANTKQIQTAHKYVFSTFEDFIWKKQDGQKASKSDIYDYYKF